MADAKNIASDHVRQCDMEEDVTLCSLRAETSRLGQRLLTSAQRLVDITLLLQSQNVLRHGPGVDIDGPIIEHEPGSLGVIVLRRQFEAFPGTPDVPADQPVIADEAVAEAGTVLDAGLGCQPNQSLR